MQKFRDEILAELENNLNAEQLKMVDVAVAKVLKGYKIIPEETLPAIVNDSGAQEVREYLARKKSKGLRQTTLMQYEQVLRAFCLVTQKAIKDIKDWDILNFLDQYESYRHVSKRRKDGMRVILNGFFRYMSDSGQIASNPMVTVEAIKYRKKVRQPLTPMELEKVRRGCRTFKERAIIEFFFATGCRVSEVVNINRDEIDYYNKRIKVLGKGDKERYVFINATAIAALEDYFNTRVDDDPALFVSDRAPYKRLKKNAIEKIVRIIGERSGIGRRLFPHLIRHTTATFLYQHGMRLEDLQVLLGHDSADTTRIYAKDDPLITQRAYMMAAA